MTNLILFRANSAIRPAQSTMHHRVFLLLLASCVWNGPPAPGDSDLRLTFLHTSDIHSRLFPFELAPNGGDRSLGLNELNAPFGGAARLGYLIKRERSRAARVLHVDSGDCFQGAPVFNAFRGEPELKFLSMVGVDAAVIGNHEFDSGIKDLILGLKHHVTFDALAANYVFPDPTDPNFHELGELVQPYALYSMYGVRVAAIGMANLSSLSSIGEGGNSLALTPLEQNELLRSYVHLLHDQVDLVIVVSHLGLHEDEQLIRGYERTVWRDHIPEHVDWQLVEDLDDGRVTVWIPGVENIDIVFGGHLHVVLNPPKRLVDVSGREVLIVHSGAFAKFLGRLDVVVQPDSERGGRRVVSHKYQVFPVDNRLAPLEDRDVQEMLLAYRLPLNQGLDLRRVIGYAPKTVLRYSQSGTGDSPLGNLVAESMRSRRRVEAEFSVTNTLGIRDHFYKGPVTLEDMFNVFPFENTLTLMYLSGREVQELVDFITERSASRGCNSQAQVAGIRFSMNCGRVLANERDPAHYQHPGEDILLGSVGGGGSDAGSRAINPDLVYRVATNDYIAAGGSGFRVLKRNTTKIQTGVSLRDALIDYLATLPSCGEFEQEEENRFCDRPDETSQTICRDIFAKGRFPDQPNAKGPYADVPCIVSEADGRIQRNTSAELDTLPDEIDPDTQP